MSIQKSLRQKLTGRQEQNTTLQLADHACVAAILRGTSLDSLEIGFIIRATRPVDRWSGQLAFPGGRREAVDLTDVSTVLRETREEIGVDLSSTELLGRLDDIQARRANQMLDFFIRPFVFYTERDFELTLNPDEVEEFFWAPLQHLTDPQRQTTLDLEREGQKLHLPAVKLDKGPVLWGLTYLMTQDLLRTLR